jgi:2-oxoglutarate/2-oxoacid ferredoxin oxidoreductase subunit alpha
MCLVAMNPAALKANIDEVPKGADLIVNTDEFTKRSMEKVGYASNPLEDDSLDGYKLHAIPLTSMTVEALKEFDVTKKEAERAKNMFALGLLSWLYHRPTDGTKAFLEKKFASKPEIMKANLAAFEAGWSYGETTEDFSVQYEVKPAQDGSGGVPEYHRELGARLRADRREPAITPAALPRFVPDHAGVGHPARVEQAQELRCDHLPSRRRDRGATAAIGAAYGGALAVTTTSGPGIALKSEAIGLAVSLELPLVIVDVQRGGPSTGLPTKTEQSDLLQVMFGRNGESPVPVIAPQSPADCFDAAIEAARIAITHRTPVFLLSDGYLANGSEPWRVPDVATLPELDPNFTTAPNHTDDDGNA